MRIKDIAQAGTQNLFSPDLCPIPPNIFPISIIKVLREGDRASLASPLDTLLSRVLRFSSFLKSFRDFFPIFTQYFPDFLHQNIKTGGSSTLSPSLNTLLSF